MNLVILTEQDRKSDKAYHLSDSRADHIRSVLHLSAGDSVEVGLLDGPRGRATVESASDEGIVLTCAEMTDVPPPVPEIDLICALPRPQTLKKVLMTVATMGVRRLYLIRANRVEKSYYQSPLLEEGNLRRFLIEGLAQGKVTRLPVVTIHQKFRQFFEDSWPAFENAEAGDALRLLPHPEAVETVGDCVSSVRRLVLAVGPEGGWVDFEVELMTGTGFRPVRLGPSILRVESAVTAAVAQVDLVFNRHWN